MGAKCLRPPNNGIPVYLTELEKIYRETMISLQKIQESKGKENDVVLEIEADLRQKGVFRKLIDHLSSHRLKILDTLEHCYKVV